MTVLIAEKASVGRELAKAVNAREHKDGHIAGGRLNGDTCCVTWAVGHLVEIVSDMPQQWNRSSLPVIPDGFRLQPIKERRHQLEVIRSLVRNCDVVVNCGDAGREGELIQRYILQWCGYRGPVLRLWISSLTDEAIAKGLKSLRPGKDYDALFHAGRARNEADWLVGMNATMALTSLAREKGTISKGVLSLGRVQTPTLAMVCSRYLEHRDFVPEDFWRVKLTTAAHGVAFEMKSLERFKDRGRAESSRRLAAVSLLEITEVENSRRNVAPPLLHDLTSLQKTANSRLGMTADTTLKAAQSLYEKKLLTYPRTGSKYISEDVFRTINERIRAVSGDPTLGDSAMSLITGTLNRRCVNDSKVTDHHALLIEKGKAEGMNDTEKAIYMLVAERMIEAFGQPSIEECMKVTGKAGDTVFTATGTTILSAGWKAVRKKDEEKERKETDGEADDLNQTLPNLRHGERLDIRKSELVQGVTRPKPLLTEATLLAAMENAGKDIEDKDVKESMKDTGIGTPATRASIIETLKRRKYISNDGKHLIPTSSGMTVWKLTADMLISDVSMTGQWEMKLEDITRCILSESQFGQEIREYTREITSQIFGSDIAGIASQTPQDEPTSAICPVCGGKMIIKEQFAKCTCKDCGLYMNRTAFGKRLGTKTVVKLLENRITGIVKGLTGRSGKSFEARLKLKLTEKDGRRYANAEAVFENNGEGYRKRKG